MAPTYPPIMLGTVRKVDALADGTEGVFVTCPALAADRTMGPLLSSVPGLVPGDSVIVATVGYSRDAVQVIARTHSKFPGIDDIPDLRTQLDERLRLERAQEIDEQLDVLRTSIGEQAEHLALGDRSIDGMRSDLDALRRGALRDSKAASAIGSAAAGNAATALSRIQADRIERYGSADRTWRPRCELRPTANNTGLAASTDYVIATSMTKFRDVEEENGKPSMIVAGTGSAAPTRVVLPCDGEWEVEYTLRSTATSGQLALKVMLNADATASTTTRATTQSIFSDVGFATLNEGTRARIRETGQFLANDSLTFGFWSSVAFDVTAVYFGGVRSRIKVKRLGS